MGKGRISFLEKDWKLTLGIGKADAVFLVWSKIAKQIFCIKNAQI